MKEANNKIVENCKNIVRLILNKCSSITMTSVLSKEKINSYNLKEIHIKWLGNYQNLAALRNVSLFYAKGFYRVAFYISYCIFKFRK